MVANPLSDWAIQPVPVKGPLTVRLIAKPGRHAKVHVEYKNDNDLWVVFREITGWIFEEDRDLDVGVMACSPGDSSFQAEFWDIIANDYSALRSGKGLVDGMLDPKLNPDVTAG